MQPAVASEAFARAAMQGRAASVPGAVRTRAIGNFAQQPLSYRAGDVVQHGCNPLGLVDFFDVDPHDHPRRPELVRNSKRGFNPPPVEMKRLIPPSRANIVVGT